MNRRERRAALRIVRRGRKQLQRAQERTGITLIEMRPTERPDVWEYNAGPIHRMVREAMTLSDATGMSIEDAAQAVVDKARKRGVQ